MMVWKIEEENTGSSDKTVEINGDSHCLRAGEIAAVCTICGFIWKVPKERFDPGKKCPGCGHQD